MMDEMNRGPVFIVLHRMEILEFNPEYCRYVLIIINYTKIISQLKW